MLFVTNIEMFVKCLLLAATFGIVMTSSLKESFDKNPETPFYEMICLSFGGICVPPGECPEGKEVTVKGLCPIQQRRGVECCHSVPKSETRCRAHGGECVSASTQCPEELIYRKAKDCEVDEKCCIYVR